MRPVSPTQSEDPTPNMETYRSHDVLFPQPGGTYLEFAFAQISQVKKEGRLGSK